MKHLIWVDVFAGWGCVEGDFPQSAMEDPPAAKPAVAFVPHSGTDYDPYKDRNINERKFAIGGDTGADKYFQIITTQLARALNDRQARRIIYENTPVWKDGEIRLSKLVIDHPHLLKTLSTGFIQAISDKEIAGDLADRIHEDLFDEEALLQVAGAMLDLEITLVNPTDKEWNGADPISVLYIPLDENSSTITGIGPDLNPISWSDNEGRIPPYSFLSVNFDENSENKSTTSLTPANPWSLITSAYANSPSGHPSCYHRYIIFPVIEITIYDNHERWDWDPPEIELEIYYYNNTVDIDREPLPVVDVVDSTYNNYRHLRVHGTCNQDLDKLQIWEADSWSSDDNVAFWKDINLLRGSYQTLERNDADSDEKDAKVKIIESNLHF